MKNKFAITSNVEELLAAMSRTEERGAREAGWVVVEGKAGLGKTEAVQWYATKKMHVYLRAQPGWTQCWFLRDLALELGHKPQRTRSDLFEVASQALLSDARTIIIDEADHCLQHQAMVLETLRSLSDRQGFPVLIAGHEGLSLNLKRFPHIHSRVAEFVKFQEATEADVKKLLDALAEVDDEVKSNPALIREIRKQADGKPRLILNAIARLEAIARQNNGKLEPLALIKELLVRNPERTRRAA